MTFGENMRKQNPDGTFSGLVRSSVAYDPVDDMFKIKSMQKKFRDSFGGVALDASKWDNVLGSGASIGVASGVLTFGAGTTANAESYILSKDAFTIPFRLSIGLGFSQRIANQTFYVEAVSIDPATGLPDGNNVCAILFDGTNATNGKYRVGSSGMTPLDSAAVTLPTTALTSSLPVSVFEIEPFADECWFHGGTLDSTNARSNSYRRHQQVPEPNALYKIRMRWLNGATAPASNTNAVVQFIACQDYAELTAEITAGRGQAVAGQALGVTVVNTTNVSGTVTASFSTPTTHTLNSAASTNATSVKTSAGTVYSVSVSNTSASTRFLKLYNKASAPTVGTDIPILTMPIGASSLSHVDLGALGRRFSVGIAYAITGAAADTDATAVGAGEVKVCIDYQ